MSNGGSDSLARAYVAIAIVIGLGMGMGMGMEMGTGCLQVHLYSSLVARFIVLVGA